MLMASLMSEDLQDALSSGPRTAAELQATLGISQPTLSRLLATRPAEICRLGRARATRYAWRRTVHGLAPSQPLYRVTHAGQVVRIGSLQVLQGGFWFDDAEQPTASQWFDGLPWFLADMSPQGFLGQRFVRQLAGMGLPEGLSDWQDDHALVALACRGEDALGNLILGEESLTRWQETAATDVIALFDRAAHYPRLAQAALAGDATGSSAMRRTGSRSRRCGGSARGFCRSLHRLRSAAPDRGIARLPPAAGSGRPRVPVRCVR